MRAISVRRSNTATSTPPTRLSSTDPHDSLEPPRSHAAIQPTSYQLHGPAAWAPSPPSNKPTFSEKLKRTKKPKRESDDSVYTSMSAGAAAAYHASVAGRDREDTRKPGLFETAKHKLTRTASEKRRERLKMSIKLVGETELTKEKNSAREDPRRWWE
jgi:hypothetical protein